MPVEEKILIGVFLCTDSSNELLAVIKPGWNEKYNLSLPEKLALMDHSLKISDVFPWSSGLSDGIDHIEFCESFFVQPDVFLRIRPGGYSAFVKEKLTNAGIPFREIEEGCIALPSASKIGEVLALDYEAMIQDLNSQRVSEFFEIAIAKAPLPLIAAWDCCAGSGGKSLMLFDLHHQLDLTVSDKRESIMHNLEKRFAEHEIKNYQAVVTDLTKALPAGLARSRFNLIICDTPCTGSGTWSRTPEQLYFFDENEIEKFTALQRKIVSGVVPQLQAGGSFIYITCSVFKKENEDMVQYIRETFNLELVSMKILEGYDKKADTMFVALLEKL